MRTKILFCEKCNVGLMVAQKSFLDGFVQIYDQILLNALLCAFFTIHDNCPTKIIDKDTGRGELMINNKIIDFTLSKELKNHLSKNSDKWFCKIIKSGLFK